MNPGSRRFFFLINVFQQFFALKSRPFFVVFFQPALWLFLGFNNSADDNFNWQASDEQHKRDFLARSCQLCGNLQIAKAIDGFSQEKPRRASLVSVAR